MSDSNRSGHDSPGLKRWLIPAVVFAAIVLSYGGIQHGIYYYEAAGHAAAYSRDANNQIAAKCTVSATPADCEREIDDAARENQRDEYDLYSQKAMALWTGVMGAMAIIGISLSGVGVYLIWQTWAETRRAANAGFEANQIARTIGESQVAANVTVNCLKSGPRSAGEAVQSGQFVVLIENSGGSDGRDIRLSARLTVADPAGNEMTFDLVQAGARTFIGNRAMKDVEMVTAGEPRGHVDPTTARSPNSYSFSGEVTLEFWDVFKNRHREIAPVFGKAHHDSLGFTASVDVDRITREQFPRQYGSR